MKKLVMALVVVIFAVILAGPFAAGYKTRQTLDNLVAYINNQPDYRAHWVENDRGWLGTTGRLSVGFDVPATEAGEPVPELPLDLKINHGPVLLRDGFRLGWSSGTVVLGQELDGWLRDRLDIEGSEPFCRSDFRMSLGGAVSFQDRCQPTSLQLGEGQSAAAGAVARADDSAGGGASPTADDQSPTANLGTLHIESYRGGGTYERNGKFTYAGALPAARLENTDGRMDIGEVTVAVDLDFGRLYNKFLAPGEGHFAVASISGQTKEGEEVRLTDLQMRTSTSFNDENTLTDIEVEMSVEDFEGFGERLSDAHLVLSFEQVRLEFWEKYSQLMQEMSESEDASTIGFELLGLVMSDLVPSGPILRIKDLRFATNDGAMQLDAHMSVSTDAAQAVDPMSLIQYLQVQVGAVVDKDLALALMEQTTRNEIQGQYFERGEPWPEEELEAQVKDQAEVKLNMLVVQGMLKEDGDQYRVEFNYENGNAVLNGQTIPLPF